MAQWKITRKSKPTATPVLEGQTSLHCQGDSLNIRNPFHYRNGWVNVNAQTSNVERLTTCWQKEYLFDPWDGESVLRTGLRA